MNNQFMKSKSGIFSLFLILTGIFAFLFMSCTSSDIQTQLSPENAYQVQEKTAQEFLYELYNGDLQKAYNMFSKDVKAQLSLAQVKQLKNALLDKYGTYYSAGIKNTAEDAKYRTFVMEGNHEKAVVTYQISFKKSEDRITGFFLKKESFLNSVTDIPYVNQDSFSEESLKVGEGGTLLDAMLTVPKTGDKFPLVILVHGSGPNDMNETIGPNRIFQNIAYGLSSSGIAVLRYNKRSNQYPASLKGDYTIDQLVINDAVSAVEKALNDKRIDPQNIYILGHSLGGYLSPYIEKTLADKGIHLKGIIIAAGLLDNLADLVQRQIKFQAGLDGKVTEEEKKAIEQTEQAVAEIKSGNMDENFSFIWPQAIWSFFMKYQQVDYLKESQYKVLVLQGENDCQVFPDIVHGLQKQISDKPNIVFHYFPDMNHLLMDFNGKSNGKEYYTPGYVKPEFISEVVDFILGK